MIAVGLETMDDGVQAAWRAMRIEPEKWQCSPWGDEGGGFWVVAEKDGHVVWYNDIEHGFNVSRSSTRKIIDEYRCNETTFEQFLLQLPEAREAEDWRGDADTVVPLDLRRGGTIVGRQTTYWDLRSDQGALSRLHFKSKAETRFVEAQFSTIELVDAHPILGQYLEPWSRLFFAGTATDPENVKRVLAERVAAASGGWRSLGEYLNGRGDTLGGYGLLLHAPASLVKIATAVLNEAGLVTSELEGRGPAERPRAIAMMMGRNFIVAREFRFQAR